MRSKGQGREKNLIYFTWEYCFVLNCSNRRLPKHKFIEAIIVHVKSKYQFMMVKEKKR